MSPKTVKLAEYLFTRIRQLGVQSIHGVPGDYNLTLLDYVEPLGIHWVGSCNELNAGYAADAYSRINGVGTLITTFGVGELSAINAIAGAYAELAPVVHIVGTPTRQQSDSRALIHHTLNDGEYGRFARMYEEVTVAQANLIDPRTCTHLIDSTLRQCLSHSRPVYIQIPVDMVSVDVLAEPLDTPLQVSQSPSTTHFASGLDAVLQKLYASERPMILVDGESRAHGTLQEIDKIVRLTKWPTWTSIFGKSLVDESIPNVRGMWKGKYGAPGDDEYVKSADLILCFGPHLSGTNTYLYATSPDPASSVLIQASSVVIESQIYRDLPAKEFLQALLEKLEVTKLKASPTIPASSGQPKSIPDRPANEIISQEVFFPAFQQYLREGDILLAETGTAGYGVRDFKLPSNTRLFAASTWLSIGYMLPACQGAALAQREGHEAGKWKGVPEGKMPRSILLIGDGSLQMTVQEISTIIREKLNVLIVVLNNDGYTIERCIHGWNKGYNDVARWNYLDAPSLFGASSDKAADYCAMTAKVQTVGELRQALDEQLSVEQPAFRMIEVIMDREDCTDVLKDMMKASKART